MLRPTKRITKREIKEDPLVTKYFQTRKFIQDYGKQMNMIGLAALAVIVIVVFMGRSKRTAEMTAAGRLGIAEQYYYAMDYPRAIDELSGIVNTYSGTRAAGTATFLLANSYYSTQDIANAEIHYNLFIDDYSNIKLFTSSAYAGLAACRESQAQFIEAAQLYEKASDFEPDSFQAPFYLKEAGRCYVSGQNLEMARTLYRRIVEEYPDSAVRMDAELLAESL